MEEELQALDPREAFLKAKVEHYLRRAEEYASMARFASALQAVETGLTLDPQNKGCRLLRKNVHDQLARLRVRPNGTNGERAANVSRKGHPDLVMLVDQDESLLLSLTSSLRRSGFETVSAGTYEEAVETLSGIRTDLIISEVNFETGARGFDLYLWVKTNAALADVPFMFLAARLDRDLLIAGKRFGVDDFILKPVDNGVVIASIQNSLSRRRSHIHR
jgi:PleD family two-component response regulator